MRSSLKGHLPSQKQTVQMLIHHAQLLCPGTLIIHTPLGRSDSSRLILRWNQILPPRLVLRLDKSQG